MNYNSWTRANERDLPYRTGRDLLVTGKVAQAAPQYDTRCDSCHRMPPLDSATGTRNPATGAVKGNHETHASSDLKSCKSCHGDVSGYGNSHLNRTIELTPGAGYSRSFANQTSVPPNPLGKCSTASCHSNGKGVYRLTHRVGEYGSFHLRYLP